MNGREGILRLYHDMRDYLAMIQSLHYLPELKNRYYMSSPTETISVGVETKNPCKSEIRVIIL